MSRGFTRIWRPVAVWLVVSGATVLGGAALPGAWVPARDAVGTSRVVDLLVAGCATALAVALGWLWLITTAIVGEVLAGSAPGFANSGALRRMVLVACGTAVVAGTALPAQAGGGDPAELLAGLPLPERAVAPARTAHLPKASAPHVAVAAQRRSSEAARYVVRAGDSLWSIAEAHPGAGDSVEARWRAIWAVNREQVGDDPDLIHPGQVLRLPPRPTTQDGAR